METFHFFINYRFKSRETGNSNNVLPNLPQVDEHEPEQKPLDLQALLSWYVHSKIIFLENL